MKTKNKIYILSIVAFFGLFFGVKAYAATYYVSTSGDDVNSGASESPYKTIQKCADVAGPGDTCVVKPGTYNGRVRIANSGSESAHLIIKSETPRAAIIDGTGLGNGNMIEAINVSYITIDGFWIKNYNTQGIAFYGPWHHINILNNEISNGYPDTYYNGGHAILASSGDGNGNIHQCTDLVIDGNYIHDTNGGLDETLTVAFDVTRAEITNNILLDVIPIGIDLIGKTISGTRQWYANVQDSDRPWPKNIHIANNELINVGGDGIDSNIYIDGAIGVIIENNEVSSGAGYGIIVSSEDPDFITSNIIVRKNRVWNKSSAQYGWGFSAPVSKVSFIHNVSWNTVGSEHWSVLQGYGGDVFIKNNIFRNVAGSHQLGEVGYLTYHSEPSFDYNNYYDGLSFFSYNNTEYWQTPVFADYQTNSGQDSHSIITNPLFVDPTADFRLQSGSPAINAGGPLTTAVGSGSGASLTVADARFFSDGYGVTNGDAIQVGSQTAVVTAVNYNTNQITLDRSLTWASGAGVSYPYFGSAPDMGAYESTVGGTTPSDTTPPSAPSNVIIQ